MVQDQTLQASTIENTPSKLKRPATTEPEEIQPQSKSKIVHGKEETEVENAADGEVELHLVDSQTGLAVDISTLSGVELMKFIDDEISKAQSKDTEVVPSPNLLQLGNNLGEDERSALIKLFEATLEKFSQKSNNADHSVRTPLWWASWVSLMTRFGQFMKLGEYFETARKNVIAASSSLEPSAPLPFILLATVLTLKTSFLIKDHLEKEFPFYTPTDEKVEIAFTLPNEVDENLAEIKVLTQKFVQGLKGQEDSLPEVAAIDWLQAFYSLTTIHPLIQTDEKFISAVVSLLSSSLPQLLVFSSFKSVVYNNVQSIYPFYDALGQKFPGLVKSIFVPVESGFESFIASSVPTFEIYSHWGKISLALSKLSERAETDQTEDSKIEEVAKFFEQGIDCFEKALELNPNDMNLKNYVNELLSASGLNPAPESYLDQPENVDDENEDPDFDPANAEESSSDSSISDDEVDEDEEEEEVPLEEVPEVTIEPGQELITGTRLSARTTPPALAEDEDETVDPDFVPQVTDVEEDFEEEAVEEQAEDLAEDPVSESEVPADEETNEPIEESETQLSTEILTKDIPLEDEPEDVDPEFVPKVAQVEEDLASSDSDGDDPVPQKAGIDEEDEDEEDEDFAPQPSSSDDDEEDLSDASE